LVPGTGIHQLADGKGAGRQYLDWMEDNYVRRWGTPFELARDGETPKGINRFYVCAVRNRGKLLCFFRGDLRHLSGETEDTDLTGSM